MSGHSVDPQSGAKNRRYGGAVQPDAGWRPLGPAFTANQSEPTTYLAGIKPDLAGLMCWAVVIPAGLVGGVLHIGRWVRFDLAGSEVDSFVEENAVAVDHGHRFFEQPTDGDPVYAWMDGIVGDATGGIVIAYLPTDRR